MITFVQACVAYSLCFLSFTALAYEKNNSHTVSKLNISTELESFEFSNFLNNLNVPGDSFKTELYSFSTIPTNCTAELQNISDKITNFTTCAMQNSRPIAICRACVNQMNDTLFAYQALKEAPELESCREAFFGSDKLVIVDVLYNNVNALWKNSHCDGCYIDANQNINYNNFSMETIKFFNALKNLDDCILGRRPNETLPINNTCARCDSLYSFLNKIYTAIVFQSKNSGGICMDVVDAMNITRHAWNEKYHCVHYDTTVGIPNIVTALLIGAAPFFFYSLARNIAIIEDIKLVQPKRKSYRYMFSQQ